THQVWGQFPTVSMPTVTSSPRGIYVRAIGQPTEALNVRAYPSSTSTLLGRFQVGQEAKAYGYYGDYVLIEYAGAPDGKGWVWKVMLEVHGGELPMLEPPPTEVPLVTKTIDPTLAAQFIITQMPTRLPTFTEPPPLQIPTYQIVDGATATGGIPMGYIIVVLAGLGFFLALIAILRRG
ncbi:MAG TPA: SH3 domain-containing protein, partial [Anaerolineaceae bacterium]|nr:SH3 domain-containing protein [Anaerolineaceae bacterium]